MQNPQGPPAYIAVGALSYNPRVTRLRRLADTDRTFFITANLARGVTPLVPKERDLLLEQLARQRSGGQLLLFGYVVMPNHLHLLLVPRNRGLAAIMREFKSRTGQELARLRRARGPIWQARYFDFILRRVGDFWEKLEYIHHNPVAAGLVTSAEGWRWSSAQHYERRGAPLVPIDEVNLAADRKAWLYPAPWR
jgi:putative transposase